MRSIMYDVLEINIAVTVIILLLCLFAGRFRKQYGAGWLKFMWTILLVRLLIPYNFSLPTTELRLFNAPGFEQEVSGEEGNILVYVNQNEMAARSAYLYAGLIGQESGVHTDNAESHGEALVGETDSFMVSTPQNSDSDISSETGVNNDIASGNEFLQSEGTDGENQGFEVGTSDIEESNEEPAGNAYFRYSDILLYIWLVGIGVCGIYHLLVYMNLYRKCIRGLQPVQNEKLQTQITALQKKYLGAKRLVVYESGVVQSPVLMGLIKPKLIIPSCKEAWDDKELELVIAHELCHYQNKDLWLKMLMLAACCINWFNPVVYLLKKQFYYDMELVCDDCAMKGRSEAEREAYARILMDFAGKGRKNYTFMTGFSSDKKLIKSRIYHIWENNKKKKGIVVFACIVASFLGIGLLVSCGYKPEEVNVPENLSANEILSDMEVQDNDVTDINGSGTDSTTGETINEFNYNNEHNKMIRVHEGVIYVARTDGIYMVKGGELQCIYADDYNFHRGFDIYDDALYFTGSVPGAEERRGTVYRMDLTSFEVKDVLALFSESFYGLYTITIHDGNLYTANMDGYIGFKLDAGGMAISRLDETADDFIYKEFNEMAQLAMARYTYPFDSQEGKEVTEQLNQKYSTIIDSVTCAEMLGGKYVVRRYKDEAVGSLYLADGKGNYTYLCDAAYSRPILVTESGVYYSPELDGDICFMDYEGGEEQCVLERQSDWESLYLVTYDDTYLYFTMQTDSTWVGEELESEKYIMRIPRTGGQYEVIYEIEGDNSIHITGDCGIDSEYMYFYDEYDGTEKISLQPLEYESSS